jgi:hypothetical protein
MIKKVLLSLICVTILSSCSVVMAANKDGMTYEQIRNCRSRNQFLSKGVLVMNSDYLPSGELVEVYQVRQQKGSTARAFMHGALDVSTCGLWEVVGTPMEGSLTSKEYILFRVTYDQNQNVQNIELL